MAESAIYPKITLLVVVTMMLFYLADLYDFEVRYRRGELCLGLQASLISSWAHCRHWLWLSLAYL